MRSDHSWDYSDQTLLHHIHHLRVLQDEGKIGLIGLTNTDAAHLELLIDSGFHIATNQVSCSVIDRRVVRGRLFKVCEKHHVGILAYGTLLGGFVSEKWLGAAEPTNDESLNWSLRKYLRFIEAVGGWEVFQGVLKALSTVAKIHGVSISAVATRFVLDIPVVKAVIVGTRLSSDSSKYIKSNLSAFSFQLSKADHAIIAKAQEKLKDIPGDCGDEYRRPPFLTATGDLSHHLEENKELLEVSKAVAEGKMVEYCSGSKWEPIAVSEIAPYSTA
jgi:aryl-alcohol dehydrogenase-like predicted oxidoreductase